MERKGAESPGQTSVLPQTEKGGAAVSGRFSGFIPNKASLGLKISFKACYLRQGVWKILTDF